MKRILLAQVLVSAVVTTGAAAQGPDTSQRGPSVGTVLQRVDTLHVDDDAAPGGDGATWSSAFRFLQDALMAAQQQLAVSEIRVAQGLYRPDRDAVNPEGTGDREATFGLLPGLAVRGGYLGLSAGEGEDPDDRDIDEFETILSGDLLGDDGPDFTSVEDNSLHVVTGIDVDEGAVLEGFTITAGSTVESGGGGLLLEGMAEGAITGASILKCSVVTNLGKFGGGAYCLQTKALFSDCQLRLNRSLTDGGGVEAVQSTLTVAGCTFEGNVAANVGGGLITSDEFDSPTIVTDCLFTGNAAIGPPAGGVTGGSGAAAFGRTWFVRCTFTENLAEDQGGGLGGSGAGVTLAEDGGLINCIVQGNVATYSAGGVYAQGDDQVLVNCRITGNLAPQGATAKFAYGSDVTIVTSTIANNTASMITGGVAVTQWSTVHVVNSILWNNSDPSGSGESAQVFTEAPDATAVINYSCVMGWSGVLGGTGNIGDDPAFVDSAVGDYRLLPGSPCIDAGHNWGVPQDTLDLDGDGDTQELLPLDLDDLPRFNADEQDFDPGCGLPVVVDMGAHEYQFDPVDGILFADVNGDGSVDVQDLVEVVLAWGPCDGEECCLSDLDLDGVVGVADLVEVVLRWGPGDISLRRYGRRAGLDRVGAEMGTMPVMLGACARFHLPLDVFDQARDAVYWTPGLTLAELCEKGLRAELAKLEKPNGKAFPKWEAELKGGRPVGS